MLNFIVFSILAVLMTPLQAEEITQFNLVVDNGSGSGLYEPLTEIHVFAYPSENANSDWSGSGEPEDQWAPLQIFDKWTGDTEFLLHPNEAHTTLIMPSADVSINALYKETPRWVPPRVVSYFPAEGYDGVIFLFHGRWSSATGAVQSTEMSRFIADALERRYGVVAVSSFNRNERQWDETPDAANNIDMQRIAAVRASLIEHGSMSSDTPVYLLGLSNGGKFASLFDEANQQILGFSLEARAIYIASSSDQAVIEESELPTIWVLAENDSAFDNLNANIAFESLVNRGVAAQIWTHPPSPVYPERFWNIEGLTKTDSQNIYDSLKSGGMLTTDNFLVDDPANLAWKPLVVPGDYEFSIGDIDGQLKIAYAGHWFMSDFNNHVLDFFDNPTTIIPTEPAIVGLSPDSGVPSNSVIINGTGLFNVSGVLFNGINTSFNLVSSEKLIAVVPDGATSGPVSVLTNGKTVISGDFEVLAPVINGLDPSEGKFDTFVTINGSAFVNLDSITFNGFPAVVQSSGLTWIVVRVPEGASTGPVEVTNYIGTAASTIDFVVYELPVISQFTPASGPVGATITITGEHLGSTTQVQFGSIAASFIVDSDTTITATVPAGVSRRSRIRIATPGGTAISVERFVAN